MDKRGSFSLGIFAFVFLMFLLFLFLRSVGFLGVSGLTSHDSSLNVDNVTLTKVIIEDDGSIDAVEGEFHLYDTIGCAVDYTGTGNLSIGIFSEENDLQNPNIFYPDILNDNITETVCTISNTCLAYYNVTEYEPGNWLCYAEYGNSIKLSSELEMVNSPPALSRDIENIQISVNGSYINRSALDLDDYFQDLEDDNLDYDAVGQLYITVLIDNSGVVTFVNSQNYQGYENIKFRAKDDSGHVYSNNLTVTVGNPQAPQPVQTCGSVWDCTWSTCINGQQKCAYYDKNSCGNSTNKPLDLTRSCQVVINQQQAQTQPIDLGGEIEVTKPSLSGTKRILVMAGIGIILLLILSLGVYLLIKKGKKPEKKEDTKPVMQQIKQEPQKANINKLSELKTFIESSLQKGQTEQKIRSDLLNVGWLKKDVDYCFNYVALKKYVKEKLNTGFTKEKIVESLKAKGWDDAIVNDVLNSLGSNKV